MTNAPPPVPESVSEKVQSPKSPTKESIDKSQDIDKNDVAKDQKQIADDDLSPRSNPQGNVVVLSPGTSIHF